MSGFAGLIYDGHCRFCRRQASRLSALSGGRLKLESFHDAGVLERYPGLTPAACEQALQLVLPDGRIFSGAAAIAEALRLNPSLRAVAALYRVPGLKSLADGIYRWVAAHRGQM